MISSFIRWVDHDQQSRDRMAELMRFGQHKESRDELGIGTIRDSISDQLFPGTSVLMSRLRYMFFIPWIYQPLEERKLSSARVAAEVESFERKLIERIRGSEDDEGLLGRRAGEALKILPSSIYWTGLGAWGMRTEPYANLSQGQYHSHLPTVYHRMRESTALRKEAMRVGEGEDAPISIHRTWVKLPPAPDTFHDSDSPVDFRVTVDEGDMIYDLLKTNQGHTALFDLAKSVSTSSDIQQAESVWDPLIYSNYSPYNREIIDHARIFSYASHGGALLYNYLLAKHKPQLFPDSVEEMEMLEEKYRLSLDNWRLSDEYELLQDWDLARFQSIARRTSHRVDKALEFVSQWVGLLRSLKGPLTESIEAGQLIKKREIMQKMNSSRFKPADKRVLENWKGESGTNRLSFRWSNIQILIRDLHAGLSQGR